MNDSTTVKAFLETLFGDAAGVYHGSKFAHSPDLLEARGLGRITKAMYTNASTFALENGEVVRSKRNISRVHMVVLDDIIRDYPQPALEPTAIIESSQGNFQYVYVFKSPLVMDAAQALLNRIKALDVPIGDPGALTVERLVRLPLGMNGKDGSRFPVRLQHTDGPKYSVDELVEAWSLPDVDYVAAAIGGSEDGSLADAQAWAGAYQGEVRSIEPGKVHVLCPNAAQHTQDGGAKESTVFVYADGSRAFRCLHGHCSDLTYAAIDGDDNEFESTWSVLGAALEDMPAVVVRAGVDVSRGPAGGADGPVDGLLAQWCLIESEGMVYDLQATAATYVKSMRVADFRNANQQVVDRGPRGGVRRAYDVWIESTRLHKLRGHHYDPTARGGMVEHAGVRYLNSYHPPSHSFAGGAFKDIDVFLGHVSAILPVAGEAEIFLDWLAYKIQNPAERSWAIVMVATEYGIGRTTLGKIIGRVLQEGVTSIDFNTMVGKGSQAAYTDWLDGNQIIIINEGKQDEPGWKADHSAYERMKDVVDDSPTYGMRVTPKYGRVRYVDVYCVFLMFTNHEDAIQMPANDRRFTVLRNADTVRSDAAYSALRRYFEDPACIAGLHAMLMQRDVSKFNAHRPPMTPAKRRMIDMGASVMDDLWAGMLERLPGDVATVKQLERVADNVMLEELGIEDKELGKFRRMVRVMIKKMPALRSDDSRSRLTWRVENSSQAAPARIVRNSKAWQDGEMVSLLDEARKNGNLAGDNLTDIGQMLPK